MNFTGSQRFLSVQFDITNACNLSCLHCYHENHNNRGALDLQGWREILDQYGRLADKLYLEPNFVLCGGEPTISPLFMPMIEEIKSRWPDARITVLTNATRLSPQLIASLRGSNIGFQISLDGPDEPRHDLIRGAGNFAHALAGLGNLQSAGLNASFLATLSRRTSPWIGDFFATASRARAERMSFTRFVSQGSGRRLEESLEDGPLAGAALRTAMLAILDASRN
ncbi:MAG: radical SAM protein, partial [Elusimicrobia bacterium]|nr:radical SAM protein [Elusimicrobiota bacterium]